MLFTYVFPLDFLQSKGGLTMYVHCQHILIFMNMVFSVASAHPTNHFLVFGEEDLQYKHG
jgi:hypothetical protein